MNRSAIVAVLAVAGSALIMLANIDFRAQTFERGLLVPGLEDRINDIASVEFASADQRVTFEQDSEGSWRVAQLEGYPADFERAKEFILGLAEATRLEAKTTRPERHAEIGLEGVGQNSPTIGVTLADASGDTIAEVLMGDLGPGMNIGERFVRLAGEDATFLARVPSAPDVSPERWAERELTRLSAQDVRSFEIITGGDRFVFTRERPDAVFRIGSAPTEGAVARNTDARRTAGAMTSVTWTGVESVSDAPQAEIGAISSFTLFDGRTLIWTRRGDTRRVTLAASYTPNEGESAATIADIETEVADFNQRHGPWVYELAAATIDLLFPAPETLADGLEPAEPEGPVGPVPGNDVPVDEPAPLAPGDG